MRSLVPPYTPASGIRHFVSADLWARLCVLTNKLNSVIILAVAPGSNDNCHFVQDVFTTNTLARLATLYNSTNHFNEYLLHLFCTSKGEVPRSPFSNDSLD